jgi:hypothetical protein
MAFRGFKREEVCFFIIKCRNNEKLASSDGEKNGLVICNDLSGCLYGNYLL